MTISGSSKLAPPNEIAEPAPAPTRIQASKGWVSLRLDDIWRYRELVYFLALRDVKVRYRQTVLGAAWILLQPLATMLVFTAIFGRLAKLPSDGVPYAAFALAALVPWIFFANGIGLCANSLVSNTNLVSKIYFPRLCVPIATVLAGLVDLLIALAALTGLAVALGLSLGPRLVLVPFLVLLAVAATLGVGLWLAAVAARYRDVRHVVPFLTQFWLFATPVAYSSTLIPERWRPAYAVNPMVGVIDGFRWSFLGVDAVSGFTVAISALSALALLVSGAFYFRRSERTFADVI